MMNQNDSNSPGRGANANPNSNLSNYQLAQMIGFAGSGRAVTASAAASASPAADTDAQTLALLSILQQQQRPLAATTMDRESNAQAQALLRHHEERLRATRLLLEQQEQQGNVQQHPLLLASNAMAAAKAAQTSILGGLGGAVGGGALLFPSGETITEGDEKLALLLAAQEGQIAEEDLAAESADREGEEANLKVAAESDEEKEAPDNNVDDDEGYDDKMTDDDYFENFNSNDDNRVIQETFPLKLYRMLFEIEKSGKQNIVSFLPHGKSFVVHKPKAFVDEIMPKYFTTCRLASFQRQLNLYGFRRITEGREKGAYSHDFFLKGKRALCRKVKRQKTRVKAAQHHSFGDLASLAAPTQPFLGLGANVGFPGVLAAAAVNPNLGGLLRGNPAQGLGASASSLLGRLSSNGLMPNHRASIGAGGDVGYTVLQEALRHGLLTDVSSARQQGSATASSLLATQELQKKLQEQEAELIIQRLRQQQDPQAQPPPPRRQSNHENQG